MCDFMSALSRSTRECIFVAIYMISDMSFYFNLHFSDTWGLSERCMLLNCPWFLSVLSDYSNLSPTSTGLFFCSRVPDVLYVSWYKRFSINIQASSFPLAGFGTPIVWPSYLSLHSDGRDSSLFCICKLLIFSWYSFLRLRDLPSHLPTLSSPNSFPLYCNNILVSQQQPQVYHSAPDIVGIENGRKSRILLSRYS